MFRGFAKFIEQDDATVSYVHPQPHSATTGSYHLGATGSYHTGATGTYDGSNDPTATNFKPAHPEIHGKLKQLVNAVTHIDPFFHQRNRTFAAGTPDYMSPEMSSGKARHDEDHLTDFYASVRRTHPEIADHVRQILPLFKRFHVALLNATEHARDNNHLESARHEFMYRLDLRSAQNIRQAVEKIKNSIAQFNQQDLQILGEPFRRAFQHFQQFHTAFDNVFHHVERHIGDRHASVKHMAWDYTREW